MNSGTPITNSDAIVEKKCSYNQLNIVLVLKCDFYVIHGWVQLIYLLHNITHLKGVSYEYQIVMECGGGTTGGTPLILCLPNNGA